MIVEQDVNVGNLWEPVSHKFYNPLHRERRIDEGFRYLIYICGNVGVWEYKKVLEKSLCNF